MIYLLILWTFVAGSGVNFKFYLFALIKGAENISENYVPNQMISNVSASDWTPDIQKTVGPPYDILL